MWARQPSLTSSRASVSLSPSSVRLASPRRPISAQKSHTCAVNPCCRWLLVRLSLCGFKHALCSPHQLSASQLLIKLDLAESKTSVTSAKPPVYPNLFWISNTFSSRVVRQPLLCHTPLRFIQMRFQYEMPGDMTKRRYLTPWEWDLGWYFRCQTDFVVAVSLCSLIFWASIFASQIFVQCDIEELLCLLLMRGGGATTFVLMILQNEEYIMHGDDIFIAFTASTVNFCVSMWV